MINARAQRQSNEIFKMYLGILRNCYINDYCGIFDSGVFRADNYQST